MGESEDHRATNNYFRELALEPWNINACSVDNTAWGLC